MCRLKTDNFLGIYRKTQFTLVLKWTKTTKSSEVVSILCVDHYACVVNAVTISNRIYFWGQKIIWQDDLCLCVSNLSKNSLMISQLWLSNFAARYKPPWNEEEWEYSEFMRGELERVAEQLSFTFDRQLSQLSWFKFDECWYRRGYWSFCSLGPTNSTLILSTNLVDRMSVEFVISDYNIIVEYW